MHKLKRNQFTTNKRVKQNFYVNYICDNSHCKYIESITIISNRFVVIMVFIFVIETFNFYCLFLFIYFQCKNRMLLN